MTEQTRTLITEYVSEGAKNPLERGCYSIIACRLVSIGGFECDRIEATKLDDHYLLTRTNISNNDWEALGVVDSNKPEIALDRMYDAAKRIAEERAKSDGNKVIDLTSRGKKVVGDEKYSVPDKYLSRCD